MHSSSIHGLTTEEIATARKQYGYNEITEHEVTFLVRLFKKLFQPISIMMEIAMLLSIVAGKFEDFLIIGTLLIINIGVDVFQETKAYAALHAIKQTLAPMATVLRNNVTVKVPTRELVPGDVVVLSLGDIVPADAKVLEDSILSIDQSTITGESLPVEKSKNDFLYASSIVVQGSALVTVTATGQSASIGKSIDLISKATKNARSEFERAILRMSRFLIGLAIVLSVIVFTSLILRGDPLVETIRFVLVLIVASIPVALPTVLSVTMALGARRLAAMKAIVSTLRSIEALAGIDQLCVDKTGTLTKNQIAVFEPHTYGACTEEELFTYALLASDEGYKTPIEHALFEYTQERKLMLHTKEFAVTEFVTFDPRTKVTEAQITDAHGVTSRIIMGAPQIIAAQLTSTEEHSKFMADVQMRAHDGFKTLGLACKKGKEVSIIGLIPLLDPPRDDAASVIANIRKKGVRIRMITGDSSPIAAYVANLLGIGKRIATGPQLQEQKISCDDCGDHLINNTDVFAEVTPEDKYQIVEALQNANRLVAMTGDGVNDAPALKRANVGFAVSGATDAARSAADIVLLGKSLNVIEAAIGYSRVIFARMQSYATFRISETIRIILFVSLSILAFNFVPVTAVMIIMLALLNDIPVMAIAYDNAPESEHPIRWDIRETIIIASVLGVAGLVSSFLLLYWLQLSGLSVAIIQTLIFLKLDVAGHSTLYLTRTGRKHFWERPFPSLPFFLPAFSSRIIGTLLALFGIFMEPISVTAVIGLWIYATVWFLINDQIKVLAYKILDNVIKKPRNPYTTAGGHPKPSRVHASHAA